LGGSGLPRPSQRFWHNIRITDRIVDVIADGFDVTIRVGVLNDSSLTAKRIAP